MARSIAPVAEAALYCLIRLGMKRWKDHVRAFDLMRRYCVTPPVTPVWEQPRQEFGRGYTTPVARQCIACGRTHITSEECGREGSERVFRSAVPRRHDGYSLQRAANMGCFQDSDNWS